MANVESLVRGPATILRVHGPLVEETTELAARYAKEGLRQSVGRVILDAESIPFADSCGVEFLLDLADDLRGVGQTARIAGAGETFREILSVTGVVDQFEFFEDVPQAVRSLL